MNRLIGISLTTSENLWQAARSVWWASRATIAPRSARTLAEGCVACVAQDVAFADDIFVVDGMYELPEFAAVGTSGRGDMPEATGARDGLSGTRVAAARNFGLGCRDEFYCCECLCDMVDN